MGYGCREENVRTCIGALEAVLDRSGGTEAVEAALAEHAAA
jgi:aspartate aminotransferase-like enzyme